MNLLTLVSNNSCFISEKKYPKRNVHFFQSVRYNVVIHKSINALKMIDFLSQNTRIWISAKNLNEFILFCSRHLWWQDLLSVTGSSCPQCWFYCCIFIFNFFIFLCLLSLPLGKQINWGAAARVPVHLFFASLHSQLMSSLLLLKVNDVKIIPCMLMSVMSSVGFALSCWSSVVLFLKLYLHDVSEWKALLPVVH